MDGLKFLSSSGFWKDGRKRNQRSGIRRHGTGLLYPQRRRGLSCHIGAYIGKERSLAGEAVSITALEIRLVAVGRPDYLPGMLCVRRQSGARAGVGVRDASQCIPRDGGEGCGEPLFLFMTFCRIINDRCRVPEHYPVWTWICGDGP